MVTGHNHAIFILKEEEFLVPCPKQKTCTCPPCHTTVMYTLNIIVYEEASNTETFIGGQAKFQNTWFLYRAGR